MANIATMRIAARTSRMVNPPRRRRALGERTEKLGKGTAGGKRRRNYWVPVEIWLPTFIPFKEKVLAVPTGLPLELS